MKDRSKEKIAELLMDELLTRLGERGNLKRMLGEMTEYPIERLINDLVDEFEAIVERYPTGSTDQNTVSIEHGERRSAKQSGTMQAPPQITLEERLPSADPDLPSSIDPPELSETEVGDSEIVRSDDTKREDQVPPIELKNKESAARPETWPHAAEATDFRSRLEELARRVESEYLEKLEREGARRAPEEAPPIPASVEPSPGDPGPQPEPDVDRGLEKKQKKRPIEVGPGEGGRPSRIPYRVDDNEYLYIHGVMALPPGESPCEYPFMLEEKGVDGKEFAFAVDSHDLRFFLSRINQKEMNVSRKGILLLGKAESIQLHGIHHSILNELRAHGIVLPMEFGTVARGKTDLLGLASRFRDPIAEALEKLVASRWWTVTMSVLDTRIAQLFADEGEVRHERDGRERSRLSYSSAAAPPKKFDVKLLEKLLQKEKRLAESVHQELRTIAERSEIQHMVGLGSGTSDDWKLILQATYLVSGAVGYQRLFRSVTDLQYRHILFEPMLSVTGDVEDFSFLKK